MDTFILLQLKRLSGFLKTPQGLITALIVILLGALGFALMRLDHWKGEAAGWRGKYDHQVELLAFERSKQDTVRASGEYTVDTSAYVMQISELKENIKRYNTLLRKAYGDTVHLLDTLPCPPPVSGHIEIDDTAWVNVGDNAFGVRSWARLYWPESHYFLNRHVIDVLGWRKPNITATQGAKAKAYALGLAAFTSTKAGQSAAVYARYKRLTLYVGQNLSRPEWVYGLGCDILRF